MTATEDESFAAFRRHAQHCADLEKEKKPVVADMVEVLDRFLTGLTNCNVAGFLVHGDFLKDRVWDALVLRRTIDFLGLLNNHPKAIADALRRAKAEENRGADAR